jgi:hypothetical protein
MVTEVPTIPRTDERRYRRYQLRLNLHYKFLETRVVGSGGSGRTLNISSHGVLFDSDRPMPDRCDINLEPDWLFLLDSVHHLKVVQGNIVRRHGIRTAVRFETYDFRTCRRSLK